MNKYTDKQKMEAFRAEMTRARPLPDHIATLRF